jgi:hypothetical protein
VTAALGLLGGAAAVADPNYADPYATVRADFASRGEVYFSPAEKATAASAAASIASAALIDPVAVAMAAQAARAADPNYVDPALNNPDYVDPVAFAIAAANTRASAVKSAPNSNRFESEADAITYAQNSGQGALKVSSDGAITNQYGETMVTDSSGNLAPASRATPVVDEAAANAAIAESRADDAAAALAEAKKLLSYSVSDIGTTSTDLAPTPFATAESSASLQVLGVPEFNLSTDLFI